MSRFKTEPELSFFYFYSLFFGGLECGLSFAYVVHFLFLGDERFEPRELP
jgi:hypothetical protein